MKKQLGSLLVTFLMVFAMSSNAYAAVTESDAKYAQEAGQATQGFSTAIGDWGNVYQTAPEKVNSPDYKAWMKKALAADNKVKAALVKFSKIKVSAGYKKSDMTLRKFIKAYNEAINQYAPAIKKNDKKLVRKANDALLAATTLFTNWGNDFARDSTALAK